MVMMSIGALADNRTIWDEAVDYFKSGDGNGAIEKAIWYLHTEQGTGKKLGQNQEAGRDQGHATLDFAMLGVIAQQGYNQGDDLFAYLDDRILIGYVSLLIAPNELTVPLAWSTFANTMLAKMFLLKHTATRYMVRKRQSAITAAARFDLWRNYSLLTMALLKLEMLSGPRFIGISFCRRVVELREVVVIMGLRAVVMTSWALERFYIALRRSEDEFMEFLSLWI